MTATNVVGTGPSSAASNAVTPATSPGAPTIGTATAGNAQASVTFTPPASNGGSTITGYTVTATDSTTPANGGQTGTGTSSPITVSGLTNGDSYTFKVTATNVIGTGPSSAASNAVSPQATAPGAPTIGTATPGNAQASVTFTPPASNGGSTITGYTVTATDSTTPANGRPDGHRDEQPDHCERLCTNGDSYTFTVTATNVVGTGPSSAASNAVTPAAVAGRADHRHGHARQRPGQRHLHPAGVQRRIRHHRLHGDGDGLHDAGQRRPDGHRDEQPDHVSRGLHNGDSYTFTVTATNAIGTGPASAASNAVSPSDRPGAPTIGTATPGNAQASVTFTPPASNGGSTITGYTVTATDSHDAGQRQPDGHRDEQPDHCERSDQRRQLHLHGHRHQRVGTGPPSAASNAVTPGHRPRARPPMARPRPATARPASASPRRPPTAGPPSPATR